MAIVFLCPAINSPVGGIKVIYRQSEMLRSNGIESYILHPENSQFSCTWFSHNVVHHDGKALSPENDFIVIPEGWASLFGGYCIELGFGYAIYVQNSYCCPVVLPGVSDPKVTKIHDTLIRKIYENADLIMSISDDASKMIALAFPNAQTRKIMRMFCSVDPIFLASSRKEKLITYMSRKLPEHSQRMCFYLDSHLPKNWSVMAINNIAEVEVAKILARSSIFMSFSNLEGLGLPPLEAAISGNIVVGYTGEGGKEYFQKPIFREIVSGDMSNYLAAILVAIREIEDDATQSREYLDQIEKLKAVYSTENQLSHLLKFAAAVDISLKENQVNRNGKTKKEAYFNIKHAEETLRSFLIKNSSDGSFIATSESRRNAPCWCNSGKKFKHCHGALV